MGLQGKKILLIDDDQTLRTLLARVLETAGCVLIESDGVTAALKALEENRPDLVILDLTLAEQDGFAFLKLRRENKLISTIPVVVLSGSQNNDDIQKALEMGADQFLPKPFEARIVLQKLRFIFFRKEEFTYKLPPSEIPTVNVEIYGELIEQCIGRLKLESQVRFMKGKSVTINAADYHTPFIGIVDDHVVDLRDGLFRTPVSITGLPVETKQIFEMWLRSLSE